MSRPEPPADATVVSGTSSAAPAGSAAPTGSSAPTGRTGPAGPPETAGPAGCTGSAGSSPGTGDAHPGDRRLTAADVRTYATLAWLSIPLVALVDHSLMWLPAAGLFLLLRERDQAGLLRRHLAQTVSFSAVMTIYALVLRQILETAGVHGRWTALYPVFVALAVTYPCVRGVQAARRLEPYAAPEPLAWIPLDRD